MPSFVPVSMKPAPFAPIVLGNLKVKVAETPDEVVAAQRLRYQIFVGEIGAHPTAEMQAEQRDFDEFDLHCDHMLVIAIGNDGNEEIVGTYRLLRAEGMKKVGRYYSEDEFDVSALKKLQGELLELGRSCVREDFRNKAAMQLLWRGIGEYVTYYDIKYMFGCASFAGSDPKAHEQELAFLHHFHSAPEALSPKALPSRYVDMNMLPKDKVDQKRAFYDLPVLIKGYLRLGGFIGDGAVIDAVYNTVDVSIVVDTSGVGEKYVSKYAPDKKK
ncbi:MAG: GNAT family N-acyltransferase [Rickettsiales bacterium]